MSFVSLEHEGGALLVVPTCARLDAETAVEFSTIVGAEAHGRSRLTVSLANVEAVDCSGLAALVVVLKRMPPGGELRLSGVRPSIRALLESTGLDAIFPIIDEAGEGAAAAGGLDVALAP